MTLSQEAKKVFAFEGFHLDARQRRLFGAAREPLSLPSRAFDTLLYMVQHPNELIDKRHLMEAVWPQAVVEENNLSQHISLLRKVLGEAPGQHRFIVTVPGRGFCFVPQVRELDALPWEDAAPKESVDHLPPSGVAERNRGWPLGLPAKRRSPAVVATVLIAVVAMTAAALLVIGFRGDSGHTSTPEPSVQATRSSVPTVAVLPFETMGTAPDDLTFASGIAETLLHRLAQSPDLLVIARDSSFAMGAGTSLDETSRRLQATYLITGSVQREGEFLRITTHLVDASTGAGVWSHRFDRPSVHLFSLQDEIASEVAQALQLNVEQQRLISSRRSGTRSIEAWLEFQRGSERLALRSRDDLLAGESHFRNALGADPRFAAAMVALAETRILRSMSADSEFWGNSRPVMSDAEREDTLRLISDALRVDPENGEAYAARAWLQPDLQVALADARRGVELSPNNATAVRRLAQLVYYVPGNRNNYDAAGRRESLQLLQVAEKLDPLSAPTLLLQARGHLYSFGEKEQALAIAERLTAEHPDFHAGWVQLGEVLWCCRGEIARAIVALERARRIDPHAQWTRDFLSQAYLDIGDMVAARAVIRGPEFVRSGSHVALLLTEGRIREAVDRGIRYLDRGTTGLNTAVLMQALYAEAAIDTPLPESIEAARSMLTGSSRSPAVVALVATQQLKLGDVSSRPALIKAVEDMKDIAYRRGRSDTFMLRDLMHAQLALGDLSAAVSSFVRAQSPEVRVGSFWYLARDPMLDPIRSDPEFVGAFESTRTHLAAERSEVERLRDQGMLPRYH